MAVPQAGRKRFRGILEGYADGEVRLFIDNPEGGAEKLLVGLPFADIARGQARADRCADRGGQRAAPACDGAWQRLAANGPDDEEQTYRPDDRGGQDMAEAAVSANRLELLQIADAVAREKSIDKTVVLAAMEDAIQRAAKSRYGAENEIRAEIDAKTGEMRLNRLLLVVEKVENDATEISLAEAQPAQSGGDSRRLYRRALAADRIRPHRRAERQAGDRAEGARCRARAHV